jgi:peroxiredoxin
MQIRSVLRKIGMLVFAALSMLESIAQTTNITINVRGMENSPLILAYYYGDKQYIKDTFLLDKTGVCNIKMDTVLPPGIYLAVFPKLNNKYFEFVVSEPRIILSTDVSDLSGNMKVESSNENKVFYDDMVYLSEKRKEMERYNILLKEAKDDDAKGMARTSLQHIDEEVKAKRISITNDNPNTLYAKLLRAMREPVLSKDGARNAKGALIDSAWQWREYKERYWNNVDFSDDRLLRTPIFHNKLSNYYTKVIIQNPDSIIKDGDAFLSRMKPSSELFKYSIVYMLNEMAKSKIMGFDAVYTHIVNNYYAKGYAKWVEEDELKKITDRGKVLAPLLIGKIAPRLSLKNEEGEYRSLQAVDAKYTILSFWDTDCGHCKSEIPKLINACKNLKASGINVEGYSATIGDRSTLKDWKSFIKDYKLDWINVADFDRESNFRFEWDIQSAPQFYLLDKDKKIIAKKIAADQVEDFIRSKDNPTSTRKVSVQISETGNEVSTIAVSQSNPQEKPKQPPVLVIKNLTYADSDKNNIFNGNEKAFINFNLSNTGKGKAFSLKVKTVETTGQKGIFAEQLNAIGSIEMGNSKEISIPISSTQALATGKANFKIIIEEGNGFDADPVELEVKTKEFLAPRVIIADYAFSTENGGPVKLGLPINLRVIVQNAGQGKAKNVGLSFEIPNNIFASDLTDFNIGDLQAGETKIINFEFFGNKQYASPSILIKANLTEADGYSEDKSMDINLQQVLTSTQKVQINSDQSTTATQIQIASLSSDVDKNIPITTGSNKSRYALVIGNEDYTKYQTNLGSEVNVAYASSDARIFAAYCEKTLGVPKENITYLENAIGSKMKQEIDRLSKVIQYENGNAEVILYYAGHGFPDETTKESYIMPVDISGSNVTDGIKLSDLYQKLTANPVKRVSVFLDACFSGGGRDAGLLAARSVKVKPKANAISGNLLVLSASSGEQSSLPYKEKQHGMFTYYLLKKLQETKGDVLYKDLFDYVKQQVELNSIKVNGKDQNPQLNYSSVIENNWGGWKVK